MFPSVNTCFPRHSESAQKLPEPFAAKVSSEGSVESDETEPHSGSSFAFAPRTARSAERVADLSSPFHKFGHVYLDLEARWTIGNFGHGMLCPPALARNVSVFMKWTT